jgi:predicted nuclease of predicted toxin-antitoxin system
MQVLADHCLPTDLVRVLQRIGADVKRARELGLERASDDELFRQARRLGRLLVSTDHDFTNVARFDIRRSRGVVVISLADASKASLRMRVEGFFRSVPAKRLRGRLAILEAGHVIFWPKRRR